MVVFKLWYLAFFSASSCLYPYFNVIFRRTAGLDASQLGTLAALRPWIGLPAGAALSGIADKWRLHRAVLLITFVLFSAGRFAVGWATSFGGVLALMLFADACGAPVTIIVDSSAMAAFPGVGEYGRQRLYGAVGWGVFSFVAGSAMDSGGVRAAFALNAALSLLALGPTALLPFGPLHAKLRQQNTHADGDAAAPWEDEAAAESGAVAAAVAAFELHALDPAHRHGDPGGSVTSDPTCSGSGGSGANGHAVATRHAPPSKVHFWQGVGVLATNPEALLFFAIALVFGYAVGSIEGFLFLYLEDLGGSKSLMGLTLSVTCVAETAVFYYTGAILQRLGLSGCFHLCFAAFLLRLGAYATLSSWPSPWLVLPVELLHGLTFGLTWSAGTAQCALIAPPGLEATTQSAFQGLLFGLGHGLGGLVGGRVYQRLGPGRMYALAFAVVACGWVVTTVARRVVQGRCSAAGDGTAGGTAGYKPVAVVEVMGPALHESV